MLFPVKETVVEAVKAAGLEVLEVTYQGEWVSVTARKNDLRGIVNGIDYADYNPENDKYIDVNYNIKNFRKEKIKNKRLLQKQLGLEQNDKVMMIGIVSRLTDQKGFDLIAYMMDELCQDDVQIVVLGTGEEKYENMFRYFDWKYNN